MAGTPAPRQAHCAPLALSSLAPLRSRPDEAGTPAPRQAHCAPLVLSWLAPLRSRPDDAGTLHPARLTALRSRSRRSLRSVRARGGDPARRPAHCAPPALSSLAPLRRARVRRGPPRRPAHCAPLALSSLAPLRSRPGEAGTSARRPAHCAPLALSSLAPLRSRPGEAGPLHPARLTALRPRSRRSLRSVRARVRRGPLSSNPPNPCRLRCASLEARSPPATRDSPPRQCVPGDAPHR